MSRTVAPMQYATARAAPAPLGPLDRVLFYVFLAILGVRPLISENFLPDMPSFLETAELPHGATPATIALLDGALLVASALVFARHSERRRGGWWFWAGAAALALAFALSVAAAGDKRLALNAGANLLITVLAGGALVRLMRAAWMPRLLLAVVLAGGGASAVKCILQKTSELQVDLRQWREVEKPKLVARGYDLESPDFINYERRLQSAEPFGFLFHPNLAASCLMMGLLAGGGLLAGQAVRAQPRPRGESAAAVLLAAMLCAPLSVALWFTGSLGALGAAAGGLLLLIGLGIARRWIAPRAGVTAAVLLFGYAALIAAGAWYGASKGTLPHPSLAFRWHYWSAGLKAFHDAPVTGLGRENFSNAFLLHKSPQSTEEVRDPHNVWVSLLVEMGPLGLFAGALLVAACLTGALRRLNGRGEDVEARGELPWPRLLLAAGGVLSLQAIFGSLPLRDANIALIWIIEIAGAWLLFMVLTLWLLEQPDLNGEQTAWLTAGLAASICGALAHNLVDFALLTPAGLAVFVALTACAFTFRPEPAAGGAATPRRIADRGAARLPILLGAAAAVALYVLAILLPAWRIETRLDQMHAALRQASSPSEINAALEDALRGLSVDPWNAHAARTVAQTAYQQARRPRVTEEQRREQRRQAEDAARRAGIPEEQLPEWLRQAEQIARAAEISDEQRLHWLRQAEQAAQLALRRNPRAAGAYRWLADIQDELARVAQTLNRPDDAARARQEATRFWQQAVERSPTNPRWRIDAGESWFQLWKQTRDREAARAAQTQFQAAFQIDAQRPPGDTVRLQSKERALVDARLAELRTED